MKEVGEAMLFAASTMHIWVRPAVMVLAGVVIGALEMVAWAIQDR